MEKKEVIGLTDLQKSSQKEQQRQEPAKNEGTSTATSSPAWSKFFPWIASALALLGGWFIPRLCINKYLENFNMSAMPTIIILVIALAVSLIAAYVIVKNLGIKTDSSHFVWIFLAVYALSSVSYIFSLGYGGRSDFYTESGQIQAYKAPGSSRIYFEDHPDIDPVTGQQVMPLTKHEVEHLLDKRHTKKTSKENFQNIPIQISYGWIIDDNGRLVANLRPGEEVSRPFHLRPHHSTPDIVIPEDYYSFNFTNLQTIIVKEGGKKTIVNPEDYYDMGKTTGKKIFGFSALEKGADITLKIKRKGG